MNERHLPARLAPSLRGVPIADIRIAFARDLPQREADHGVEPRVVALSMLGLLAATALGAWLALNVGWLQ